MIVEKLTLISRWSIFCYLLIVPWSIIFFPWSPHDYGRIIQVWILTVCTIVLSISAARDRLKIGLLALSVVVALITAVSVSTAESSNPGWAWREVGLFVGLLATTVFLGREKSSLSQLVLRVAVASFAFYGALELVVINLGLVARLPVPAGDFAIGYDNPRFFNHVATVALPLCATAAATDDRLWIKRAAWFALTIGFALTLYTGGRAVLVGDATALLALIAIDRRRSLRLVRVAITGALAGTLLYCIQFLALPGILHLPAWSDWAGRLGDQGSVGSRLVLWRDSLTAWMGAPIWGIGPMHFAHIPNSDAAHPHNIYLQILCEWGIVPFIAVLIFIFTGVWGVLKKLWAGNFVDERAWIQGAGLLATVFAALVDGGFSGNFVMPHSQMWIMVAAGALWNWSRHAGEPYSSPVERSPVKPAFPAEILCCAIAVLVLLSAIKASEDFLDLPRVLGDSSRLSISERMNPRFWSEGWF